VWTGVPLPLLVRGQVPPEGVVVAGLVVAGLAAKALLLLVASQVESQTALGAKDALALGTLQP